MLVLGPAVEPGPALLQALMLHLHPDGPMEEPSAVELEKAAEVTNVAAVGAAEPFEGLALPAAEVAAAEPYVAAAAFQAGHPMRWPVEIAAAEAAVVRQNPCLAPSVQM
ncbi:MAG TPA: hypothetical protein DET40_26055 [Lentisphaeria bacterium]|nr:MAG: hypothetical protein A2X45_12865 [Lentisphaerae bacterium GWF2_50_93]HCE47027.1 hypothetical protein [Lentisphaeria bacterium]